MIYAFRIRLNYQKFAHLVILIEHQYQILRQQKQTINKSLINNKENIKKNSFNFLE